MAAGAAATWGGLGRGGGSGWILSLVPGRILSPWGWPEWCAASCTGGMTRTEWRSWLESLQSLRKPGERKVQMLDGGTSAWGFSTISAFYKQLQYFQKVSFRSFHHSKPHQDQADLRWPHKQIIAYTDVPPSTKQKSLKKVKCPLGSPLIQITSSKRWHQ